MQLLDKYIAERNIIGLPNLPIVEQLNRLDTAQTGVGLIFVFELMTTDDSDDPKASHAVVASIPVIKVRGKWLAPEDDNIADMLSAMIRLMASDITNVEQAGKPTES